LPSRRRSLFIGLVLALCATVLQPPGVRAQNAGVALPYQRPECGIGVREVVPIGPGAQTRSEGTQFFVYLWSPRPAHTISGTLWVNASGTAYHVRFANVSVSPVSEKPIAIRLPSQLALENVFVDTVNGESTGECGLDNGWTPAMPVPTDAVLKALESGAPDAVLAAQPITNIGTACTIPAVGGFVVHAVVPLVPATASKQHLAGDVAVLVVLRPDSTVRTVSILQTSSPLFVDEALRVARATAFRTEVHACQPVTGRFTYNIHFTQE
jgi:Gram-negative bacterial TonB protein C-terminal